jgi:phage major head subunit gpT-like protein
MITPANFAIFVTNASILIGDAYNEDDVQSVYKQVSTEVPCKSEQLTFAWTGVMPKMRGWFGARQPHQPAPQTYTVVPQPWENTYSIDRFKLDDDQYGVYYRMLPDMARQSRRHPDYQIRDLLENAGLQASTQRQSGPDGLSFWNSAHPINLYDAGAGTYTNTTLGGQSVGGVTIGGALSVTAFTSVFEYMMTIKGEDGERLGIRPDVIMHPPTLYAEVETMIKGTLLASPTWGAYSPLTGQVGAVDNSLRRFGVRPVQNDFLNHNTRWYMFDTTKPMKPLLWVVREPVITVPRMNESDPAVFDSHMFQWGQWARNCPAWNYSFLSHRSGPS